MVELTFEHSYSNCGVHICCRYRVLHCPVFLAGKKRHIIQVLCILLTNSSQFSGFYSNCPWLKRDTLPKVMTPSRSSLHPTSGWCRTMKAQPPSPDWAGSEGRPSFRALWGQLRLCCCCATAQLLSLPNLLLSLPPQVQILRNLHQNFLHANLHFRIFFLEEPNLQYYSYLSLK